MKNYIRIIVICLLMGIPKLFDAVYVAPKMTSADIAKKLSTHEARMEQLKKEREQKVQELQQKIQKGEIKTLPEIKEAQESLAQKLADEEKEFGEIKETAPALPEHPAIDIVTKTEVGGGIRQIAESKPLKAEKRALQLEFSKLARDLIEAQEKATQRAALILDRKLRQTEKELTDDEILALAKLPDDQLKYFVTEIERDQENLEKKRKIEKLTKAVDNLVSVYHATILPKLYSRYLKELEEQKLGEININYLREKLTEVHEKLLTYDSELVRVLVDKIQKAKTRAVSKPKEPLTNKEKAIIEMVFKETPKLIEKIHADMEKEPEKGSWVANQRRLFLLADLADLYMTSLDAKVGYDSSIASYPLVKGTLNLVAGLATTLVTVVTAAAFVTGAVLFFMLPLTQFGLALGVSLTSLAGAAALAKLPKIVDIARSGWSFGNWVEQKMNERMLETYKKSYPVVLSSITNQLQTLSPVEKEATRPYVQDLENAVITLGSAYELAVKNLGANLSAQKDLATLRQAVKNTRGSLNEATQVFMNALKPIS